MFFRVYSSKRTEIMNILKEGMIRVGRLNSVSASKAENNDFTLHISHTDYCDVKHKNNVSLTREQAQILLAGNYKIILLLIFI